MKTMVPKRKKNKKNHKNIMGLMPLKKIQFEDIDVQDEWFNNEILSEPAKVELASLEFEEFFTKNKIAERQLLFPQFIWYTKMIWDRFSSLSFDEAVYGVSRQMPTAILLGYDTMKEIMWYLGLRTSPYIENDRESVYAAMKKAFLGSDAVIGEEKGKVYSLKDIIDEGRHVNRVGGSLEIAEFDAKIKRIMFPKDPMVQKFFTENQDLAVARLFEVIDFFTSVEPEFVSSIIEDFLHPKIVTEQSKNDEAKTPMKKVSFQQIKSQIEKKGTGGQLDLEDIFSELDRLAKENNDDRIRDLFYFNEKTGKFEWNEELLSGTKE